MVEKKYVFIYMTKNLVNGKIYVGFHATNKSFDRDNYIGSGILFNKKVLEYGKNNFIMGIIEYINPAEWKEKEKYWIKEMKSHVKFGNGYNLTDGGDGTFGYKMTDKQLKRYLENNPMQDKHHTQYSKSLMSEIMKTKTFTDSHKTSISESLMGKLNPFFGKNHSEKSKEKMRKSKLGVPSNKKGKSYEEIYGKNAFEIKKEISKANSKLTLTDKKIILDQIKIKQGPLVREIENLSEKFNVSYHTIYRVYLSSISSSSKASSFIS
jgi:group I intron endonuclease